MSTPPAPNKFLRPLLIFAIALLVFQFFSGKDPQKTGEDVDLLLKEELALGKVVEVEIRNNLPSPLPLPAFCPQNPLQVEHYENGEWKPRVSQVKKDKCDAGPLQLEKDETYSLSYGPWNNELFAELGRYRISLEVEIEGNSKTYSQEIEIEAPSFWRALWQEGLYKPILNTLLFLIAVLPGKNLGLAVILLTLLIKLLLIFPNHKALKAQKQMQKIQPQLEALKLKHKNDSQRLAQETMELYKKYKVNPVSSCLPMLIQFPILIALFYVVRDGLTALSPTLLYSSTQSLDLSTVQTHFLGLDLTQANWTVLPLLVGGLQYLQMHLTFSKTQALKATKNKDQALPDPMAMMNKSMKYIMPVMVAVFTATLPAAVGLYWGTSTLFGIVQQGVVNRQKS